VGVVREGRDDADLLAAEVAQDLVTDLEPGNHAPATRAVERCLEELGHEVVVADPNFAPMYATRTRRVKTDRRDARALAEACRPRSRTALDGQAQPRLGGGQLPLDGEHAA
jgi:transposase